MSTNVLFRFAKIHLVTFISLLTIHQSIAGGTWAPLATAPPTGVNCCMLLGDGTVLTYDGSGNCNRLTPDIHGGYRQGSWTRLAKMNNSRLFFASVLLTNGNVFVAGGEYGGGHDHAELFDPLNNVWTKIPDPIPGVGFSDAISKILPNGNVLVAPVSQFGGCVIYNVSGNSWQTAASSKNQNEVCWVKMTNDCILTIDTGAQTSEHYVPSLNTWVVDNNIPVQVYGYGAEIGAGFLLPNGNVFYIGGSTNTAIYTPGPTVSSPGTWVAGPTMVFDTNLLGAVDAPAAMMANGKILCALGPITGFGGPSSFYEYDYVANAFTQVNAPTGGLTYGNTNNGPYILSMLDLPDGTVLLVGGQNSSSLYVYTPDGTPLAAGQPVINTVSQNADGSYHLTGTGLNGISEGAAYGDDEQMDSNYPLVRMTNSVTSNVYYARAYNRNSTSVQTGNRVLATEFSLPQNLPAGSYSLVVVANGNPSVPTNFTYSPPAIPTGLTAASGSNTFVRLNWNASAGATAYNVKRSSTVGGYYATIATVTSLSFTNTGLTNGLAYYYKVSAIGASGPSSDSAAVMAVPSGPPIIPGATPVSLASFYNRAGIFTDGRMFGTGLDGGSFAYSANLLGPSLLWNNLVFNFGPSNTLDVVFCAGQVINLPAGRFNSLQILATAVNGSQVGQTFTVTYTDSSTATFTQNFSDWANQQSFSGETTAITMRYRNSNSGGTSFVNVGLNAYVFALDQTKTVQSITLPIDTNLELLSMVLANDPVGASLATYYDRAGIYTDGTRYTNPPTGGFDGVGASCSGTLLGSSQVWSNTLFTFGPLNETNVISCINQTISLPPGNYSRLRMLATGVNGNQASQSFLVTYTDATTANFVQSVSDWFTPQNFVGETKAVPMSHRNNANGGTDGRTFYLYGYSFNLNTAKTIQSVRVPNNPNVVVTAISLVPNWQPTFNVNPLTLASINAGQAYSGTVATNAADLNGDAITYAKVSGPAWLNVAGNGSLSGVPANIDANTNTFLISATDSGGLSNTLTLFIYVNGAPSFALDPFTMPSVVAGQSYSATIATNASDPNPSDVLTFAKINGPNWLAVAPNGTLSGTPFSGDIGNNSFVVSVSDGGGISGIATMNIAVGSVPIILAITPDGGNLLLSWSGGTPPYQVQSTTDLGNPNWQDFGGPISSNSLSITPTNDATFYRVGGQ
jgi:Putative Ig domain/Galactose oxidase, central domain